MKLSEIQKPTAKDISFFLSICQNENDLDLAVNAFKKYLILFIKQFLIYKLTTNKIFFHSYKKQSLIQKDFKFAENYIKICLTLNQMKRLEIALNDLELKESFYNQINTFMLMNQFFLEKNYSKVIEIFYEYVEKLETGLLKQENKINLKRIGFKSQTQLLPFGHLRLVTESLLCLNTKEAFDKMKSTLEKAKSLNSFLNNTSLTSCFLLAIYQVFKKFNSKD
jgi:hypothetical protein